MFRTKKVDNETVVTDETNLKAEIRQILVQKSWPSKVELTRVHSKNTITVSTVVTHNNKVCNCPY